MRMNVRANPVSMPTPAGTLLAATTVTALLAGLATTVISILTTVVDNVRMEDPVGTWLMVIGVSVHLAMQEITVRKTSMNVQVTLA